MEQVKLASYEKLEEENRELKTVLRKLSHEMGNALTLLGASIFYVETDIATANGKCDVSDLKNDYTSQGNFLKGSKMEIVVNSPAILETESPYLSPYSYCKRL